MQLTSIFVSAISLVAAVVHADPLVLPHHQGIASGYSMVNLTWVGKVFEDGSDVSITGSSMQNIEAQIRELNPDFSWNRKNDTNSAMPVRRDNTHLTCDPNNIWWAQVFRIEQGIEYLKGIQGRCHVGPGPRVCTRVSCSYESAISWCNDNDHDIFIDCSLWSLYAQDILDACQTHDASNRVRGQKFNDENWNILVGLDNDHC
ncbi:uncharacterized protein F4812DRAFT_469662 [Daldinia caldariorum]|uniref:uncharacterized protein n=1 Tax=Daldinia caldariorum TaxID=326644 RepID=UPI002008316B|nr:uncharacterized protein F4812DRAFT_469662 [Daldinia caldariorum]KAI1462921.1 hypothetical protein F4812DRAFT_469662 [Daldinia caldariorum]